MLIGHQSVQVKETRSNISSPVTGSLGNGSLANHRAVLLSFVAVLYYLIKGLDGHMPPVNKALVRSCRLDTESAIKLKALTSKY